LIRRWIDAFCEIHPQTVVFGLDVIFAVAEISKGKGSRFAELRIFARYSGWNISINETLLPVERWIDKMQASESPIGTDNKWRMIRLREYDFGD